MRSCLFLCCSCDAISFVWSTDYHAMSCMRGKCDVVWHCGIILWIYVTDPSRLTDLM